MLRYGKETLGRLYYDMLRIRRFQLRIDSLYLDDEMKTPVHLCIGQEAVPVGVCAHLGPRITSPATTGGMAITWPKVVT